jgi:hypothetical protein
MSDDQKSVLSFYRINVDDDADLTDGELEKIVMNNDLDMRVMKEVMSFDLPVEALAELLPSMLREDDELLRDVTALKNEGVNYVRVAPTKGAAVQYYSMAELLEMDG